MHPLLGETVWSSSHAITIDGTEHKYIIVHCPCTLHIVVHLPWAFLDDDEDDPLPEPQASIITAVVVKGWYLAEAESSTVRVGDTVVCEMQKQGARGTFMDCLTRYGTLETDPEVALLIRTGVTRSDDLHRTIG